MTKLDELKAKNLLGKDSAKTIEPFAHLIICPHCDESFDILPMIKIEKAIDEAFKLGQESRECRKCVWVNNGKKLLAKARAEGFKDGVKSMIEDRDDIEIMFERLKEAK